MNEMGYYPQQCEIDATTEAAVEACDGGDGVLDGIVSLPGLCKFDALSVVGKEFECNGEKRRFSRQAAEIVNAVWRGPSSEDGKYGWYGFTQETNLTGGVLGTECTGNASISPCNGGFGGRSSFFLLCFLMLIFSTAEHISLLILKDPTANLRSLTRKEYFSIWHHSVQEYTSIIDTSDPDLSEFRHHGGKMLTWHGLADQLIMPNGTSHYYQRVLEQDHNAADFYRYFEAPGVAHCSGGIGPLPTGSLDAVIKWVEEGVAPETLLAKSQTEVDMERRICAWPKQQVFVGGDGTGVDSFECR